MVTSSPAACPTCCVRKVSFLLLPKHYLPPTSIHQKCSERRCQGGRQCHHSAASSSAWLSTGPKVQAAARVGRCAITKPQNYMCPLSHKISPFHRLTLTRAQTNLLRQSMWRQARAFIWMGKSWYLDADLLGRKVEISLTQRLALWSKPVPVFLTDPSSQLLSIFQTLINTAPTSAEINSECGTFKSSNFSCSKQKFSYQKAQNSAQSEEGVDALNETWQHAHKKRGRYHFWVLIHLLSAPPPCALGNILCALGILRELPWGHCSSSPWNYQKDLLCRSDKLQG